MSEFELKRSQPASGDESIGNRKKVFRSDEGIPGIWLSGVCVSICLLLVSALVLLISFKGLAHFWPKPLVAFEYHKTESETVTVYGQMVRQEQVSIPDLPETTRNQLSSDYEEVTHWLVKVGNRDRLGFDFGWHYGDLMTNERRPPDLTVIERYEWGDMYGRLHAVTGSDGQVVDGSDVVSALQAELDQVSHLREMFVAVEHERIKPVTYELEDLRLERRRLELGGGKPDGEDGASLRERREQLMADYESASSELVRIREQMDQARLSVRLPDGGLQEIRVSQVVRFYQPNNMSAWKRFAFFVEKLIAFLVEPPREANTEGGVYPAIFGTVLLVMIMTLVVTPLGVLAALYLSEYAQQNWFTRVIRVCVDNLAGVPSIIYGIFGLGFFVYIIGDSIDQVFFPESLPTPVFGTPGLLWSALTLAILTLPVVIVATEEGLKRIPQSLREGSLALGATKAETLWRVVLPMSLPAILTGQILAVARAAGEVAPLMLVGVVKHAPSLPVDGDFPYLHMDRKFMHLGFHIYDVGFQSPNVEAARPLVYATCLLLILLILILNLSAMLIRGRLRERYYVSGV